MDLKHNKKTNCRRKYYLLKKVS